MEPILVNLFLFLALFHNILSSLENRKTESRGNINMNRFFMKEIGNNCFTMISALLFSLNIMLSVSVSPGRDRACRHCWILSFWAPW